MRSEEVLPKFANQTLVRRIFGLSRTWLDAMVIRGEVRSIKSGKSKQSMRLYCIADITNAMDRMCIGKKPLCHTRKKRRTGLKELNNG